jgi:hypothetical protein
LSGHPTNVDYDGTGRSACGNAVVRVFEDQARRDGDADSPRRLKK